MLEKHYDVSFAVTAKEWTLSVEEFAKQLLEPAIVAIAQAIDNYVHTKYVEIPYFVGTAGDPPDALADLAAVDKELNDLKVPMAGRIAIVNAQAKADMLGISAVVQAEQRGDGGQALRNASLGHVMGIEWFMSQNVNSHTVGTLSDGSSTKGCRASPLTSTTRRRRTRPSRFSSTTSTATATMAFFSV